MGIIIWFTTVIQQRYFSFSNNPFHLLFILPTSHICLKTMRSFEPSQRWLQVKTKLSGIMNISYHWILKSGLLKWLQLLCFFTLPSLLKERKSGPSSDSSLSCCKRSLVSVKTQHLLRCLEKFYFHFPYATEHWSHLCSRVWSSGKQVQ